MNGLEMQRCPNCAKVVERAGVHTCSPQTATTLALKAAKAALLGVTRCAEADCRLDQDDDIAAAVGAIDRALLIECAKGAA